MINHVDLRKKDLHEFYNSEERFRRTFSRGGKKDEISYVNVETTNLPVCYR